MTPREKAKELVDKFDGDLICAGWGETAFIDSQKCALIAVDEILNVDNIKPYILHKEIIEYWQEVKQEIKKL